MGSWEPSHSQTKATKYLMIPISEQAHQNFEQQLKQRRGQFQGWVELCFTLSRFCTISKQLAQQESLLTGLPGQGIPHLVAVTYIQSQCVQVGPLPSFLFFPCPSPISYSLPPPFSLLSPSPLLSALSPLCWCHDMKGSSLRNWVTGEAACHRHCKGPRSHTRRLFSSLLGEKPVCVSNGNRKWMFSRYVIFHLREIVFKWTKIDAF